MSMLLLKNGFPFFSSASSSSKNMSSLEGKKRKDESEIDV
jgi:hypothetical protein